MTLAVETGGVGNPPTFSPNPGDIPTASRRGHGRVVVIVVVVSLAVLALLGVGAWYAVRGIGNAIFQGLGEATTQGPPAYAQFADSTAKTHHIWDGALTLSLLNQQHLDVKWLSGDDSVSPFGDNKITNWADDVSISVGGDHVVTATYVLGCVYGLTVSGTNDPIIGEEHLPGVGTYWDENAPEPLDTNICSADTAPSSGWQRASPHEIRSFLADASK